VAVIARRPRSGVDQPRFDELQLQRPSLGRLQRERLADRRPEVVDGELVEHAAILLATVA
jgi:hypothetical protein